MSNFLLLFWLEACRMAVTRLYWRSLRCLSRSRRLTWRVSWLMLYWIWVSCWRHCWRSSARPDEDKVSYCYYVRRFRFSIKVWEGDTLRTLLYFIYFNEPELALPNLTWLNLAWLNLAWLNLAWLNLTWINLAWLNLAWLNLAWLHLAWLHLAWLHLAWLHLAWLYLAWLKPSLTLTWPQLHL